MCLSRFRVVVLALLVASSINADTHHRAAAHPPADWLATHAFPLATTEATGNLNDLEPVATIVGSARVVGLGDATHGTHEFFTMKLRMMQYLVGRMGFDVLAVEGSFPQFERINAYAQGGPGDVRQLLRPQAGEQLYWYWNVEEFVAVIEWMRNYNLTRGNRLPIEIVGADMYDGKAAANMVIDYLNEVDAAQAIAAAQAYGCVWAGQNCNGSAIRAIAQQIAVKEREYTARTSARAFGDALHASVLVQQGIDGNTYMRDAYMADNVAWSRTHRGSAGKVIYWAHNEHVTRGPSVYGTITQFTAGEMLKLTFGSDYVNFGTATWSGQFLTPVNGTLASPAFTAAGSDNYEMFLHGSRAPNVIVPLNDPHPFLNAPHHMREAGSGLFSDTAPNGDFLVDLAARFNAVVFIDQTTPNHPLQ